ncbi:MAG: GNAT family N-acetyltransferase [Alphaproteobacteria bacterium]|nr:GNAT family N-acetyltransferase [Alphaproteobacteria bacterium]
MFRLRATTDADWPEAWALQEAAFLPAVTAAAGGWTDAERERCASAWQAAHTRVVEVDGAMAGWVRLQPFDTHDWLDLLVVAPARQRQGLGAAVLGRVQAEASARGVPLWLSVHRDNPARRLYARHGFDPRPRDDRRTWMVWPATTPGDAPPTGT